MPKVVNRKNRNTGEDGNTTPPSHVKQSPQLKKWFFTYNNYPEEAISCLERCFQKICVKYVFQKEVGENGTPHLQGNIWLHKAMRPSEFKLQPQIHWEKTRNENAAEGYCQKSETSIGEPFLWGWPKAIKILDNLRPWQQSIVNYIATEPDGRKLLWVYEDIGNTGKSSLCKYLYVTKNVIVIQGGKLADIMNIIFNIDMSNVTCIMIDVPRKNKNNVSYGAIECILNGMITNTKYETGIKVFNPPHVIILSNFSPNTDDTLSADRWDIREIINNELVICKESMNDIQR